MFRQQLDYRQEKLKAECDKANTSLCLILQNVRKLVGIKMPERSSPSEVMSNCKFQMEILRHIDNFSYPVIEFNYCVETLVSQVSELISSLNQNYHNTDQNIKKETETHNGNPEKSFALSVEKNAQIDDTHTDIAEEQSAELVEVVPGVSVQPITLLDEEAAIIEEDIIAGTSSEDGSANNTCIEIDLSLANEMKPLEINQFEFSNVEAAKLNNGLYLEKDIPMLKLPDQSILEINEDFDTRVTHIESPSRFYVTCECAEFNELQLEMTKHFNEKENESASMTKENVMPNNQRYFACHLEGAWLRGVLTDSLKFDDSHIEVFLLDTGHNGKIIDCRDVRPLPEKFFTLPPQAYLCHLNGVQPLPKDNHEWSKEAIDYMKKLCGTSCIINITNNSNGSLEVCLMTTDSIAVNVQLIQEDLAILLDSSDKEYKYTIQNNSESSTLDSNYATKPIAAESSTAKLVKKSFQIAEEVICYIICVESPSKFFIILQENQHEILEMVENMTNICNTGSHSFSSKKEILDTKDRYFACSFEEEWVRGTISDRLSSDSEHVEMFLIDVGSKIRMHFTEVKILDKIFYKLEPQAYACHLYMLEPPIESGGVWSSKALEYMLKVQDTVASIIIVTIGDQSLGVFLKTFDGMNFNQKMVEEDLAAVQTIVDYESHSDSPTDFPEMEPTNDLLSDFVSNLQGFSSHYDLELCKNYTGPPKTTCFKGSKCKKLHQLPNKDGWTSKRIPEVNFPQNLLTFPASDTMINIGVTAIKSCCTFYGHLLYPNEEEKTSRNSNLSPKVKQPKDLTDLMDQINSVSVKKSLVTLTSPPCIGMLLLCFVADQNKWYRAMVIDHIEGLSAMVFLVDYGIKQIIQLRHMRKLDGIFAQVPFQAVEFSLANAECECIRSGKCRDGITSLMNMTSNKDIIGFVVSSNTEQIAVVLYDEQFTDIGQALCTAGLLKAVEFKVQDLRDNELNENIKKVYSKYHKRKQQLHQEILYGVKKCGIVPSAP